MVKFFTLVQNYFCAILNNSLSVRSKRQDVSWSLHVASNHHGYSSHLKADFSL